MSSKIKKLSYDVVENAIANHLSHLTNERQGLNARQVKVDNKFYYDFSLCDYLGLSTDERLVETGVEYLRKLGTYSAVSRTYLKVDATVEAEDLLNKIFNKPTIVVPRTTLAHQAVIPTIIDRGDCIILDHQVHTSVGMATKIVQAEGAKIELLRHNNLEKLEQKIIKLREKHKKIWYFVDGVYSMYGDVAPLKELVKLLEKYEEFHLYVDDAHGMSWIGLNGCGFTLSEVDYHDKMIIATSLGKGFGSGGSVIVCPNNEIREYILRLGMPLMFTSPVSPQTLGSIIASAKIHLSKEIKERQLKLKSKIDLLHKLANKNDLPIIYSDINTPITYFPTGEPKLGYFIANHVQKNSIYISGGIYPAVPYNNTGMRIMSTLHHEDEDIIQLIEALKLAYKDAFKTFDVNFESILKNFKK